MWCGKKLSEFRQCKTQYKGTIKIIYRSQCKECELKYKREHYKNISQDEDFKKKNRERAKKYRDDNIEKVRERERKYRESHR